jgi:hypothetical protein
MSEYEAFLGNHFKLPWQSFLKKELIQFEMDDLFCSSMVSLKMCVFTLILERVGGEVYLLLNVVNERSNFEAKRLSDS